MTVALPILLSFAGGAYAGRVRVLPPVSATVRPAPRAPRTSGPATVQRGGVAASAPLRSEAPKGLRRTSAALLAGILTHARPRRNAQGSRRGAGAAAVSVEPRFEKDVAQRLRLSYDPKGWRTWTWSPRDMPSSSFECNYVVTGPEDGPAVVLVHGFGASSYHWRYQIPALASRGFRVYALCLLGFGWAPKTVLRYSGEVWAEQITAFVHLVVGKSAVLVGNSIGAFASLLAASLEPDLCQGLVMLNAAGRFEERQPGEEPSKMQMGDQIAKVAEETEGPLQWLLNQVKAVITNWSFYTTKQQIQPIMEWIYVNDEQVDEDLVTSIRSPAEDPNALSAFGEIIQAGRRTEITVFEALDKLPTRLPVLLLWGMSDPWMRPARAAAIRAECDERGLECEYRELDAGHCPQDDAPDDVNAALLAWLSAKGWAPAAAEGEVVTAAGA